MVDVDASELVADESMAPVDPTSDVAPTTMAASNREYKKARDSSKGTLDFILKIWLNPLNWRLSILITSVSQAYDEDVGIRAAAEHTQQGLTNNHADYATGAVFRLANETLMCIASTSLFRELHIISESENCPCT